MRRAAIALMLPRRQHIHLPTFTYNTLTQLQLHKSAPAGPIQQRDVTPTATNRNRTLRESALSFYTRATCISHAHSLQQCCLQRPRPHGLLIFRCNGGAKNSRRSTLIYRYIAARNFHRGLSALNSAFAKGEISVYAFAFCERRNATCYKTTVPTAAIPTNLDQLHRYDTL